MSCNGCRVLRKGCNEGCILRPCLAAIEGPEAQGHATLFLAKFFGRAGLMGFISAVQDNQRAALFQSLLFEACGRTINPVYGSAGLLWSGQWHLCEAAVETVLQTGSLQGFSASRVSLPSKSSLQSSVSPLPALEPQAQPQAQMSHSACTPGAYPGFRMPVMMDTPLSFWPLAMSQVTSGGGIPIPCGPLSGPYGTSSSSAFAAFRSSFQPTSCQGNPYMATPPMHAAALPAHVMPSQSPVNSSMSMQAMPVQTAQQACPMPMHVSSAHKSMAAANGGAPAAYVPQYLQANNNGCMSPVSGTSGITSNSGGNCRGVSRGSPGDASTCGSPPLVAPVARRLIPQQRAGKMKAVPGMTCSGAMGAQVENGGFVLSDTTAESVGSPGEIEVGDIPFPMEPWNPIEDRGRTLLPLLS